MLIRPHDDGTDDPGRWRAFVTAQGFGQLIASGRDREIPVAVPTQFLLDPEPDDEGHAVIRLHLAKQNPVFDCLAENRRCLLSVAGDWAYIPGRWKVTGDEDPRRGIPTTYYGAVQLACTATVVDRPEEVAEVLGHQLADLEPGADYIDPIDHGPHLRVIRALILTVDDVRAKFKYGGNVDEAHRAKVAAELEQRAGPGDGAARAAMDR